jgi:hypothetical protein
VSKYAKLFHLSLNHVEREQGISGKLNTTRVTSKQTTQKNKYMDILFTNVVKRLKKLLTAKASYIVQRKKKTWKKEKC